METVAHVRLRYLPLTETFIYREITGIKAYRTLVLCAEKSNLDQFPYRDLRCTSDLGLPRHLVNGLLLKLYLGCPYFSKVIADENVRLLHAHYGPTGTRMLPLKRKHKIPLVTSFRGIDASLFPARKPGMYGRLFSEGDLFLARSEDMKKDLIRLGCPEGKATVHHSGINLSEYPYRPRETEGSLVYLTVARLTENKGAQYAIQAFAKVRESHPDARLRIVGEGPYRGALESEAKRLGGGVDFLGQMPRAQALQEMLKADVLVQPSYTTGEGEKEGVPNVLMEAQATGMPVVSTRHAGIPEVVLDGRSGLLAEEKDAAGLANLMLRLADDRGLWARMGEHGRRHVEAEFNIATQSKRLEDIYNRLICAG
jgi:colanic acid/amylovoran biosynthesis glycosyltransferase